MARYHNITETEMHDFLTKQGFTKIDGLAKELVYGQRKKRNDIPLSLRVYTGIVPGSDSREVGTDAIRVCLFTKVGDKIRPVASARRVHRVKGWKQNLQDRLDNWEGAIVLCKCGKLMNKRKGPYGAFFGCTSYPA